MTDRAGLTADTAADDGALDVKLAHRIGRRKGLTDNHLQGVETEIVFDIAVVDRDLAGAAGIQTDAGNTGLSAAGAIEIRLLTLIHRDTPLCFRPRFGLLRGVDMLGALEDLQAAQSSAADVVRRKHAANGEHHREVGLRFH